MTLLHSIHCYIKIPKKNDPDSDTPLSPITLRVTLFR